MLGISEFCHCQCFINSKECAGFHFPYLLVSSPQKSLMVTCVPRSPHTPYLPCAPARCTWHLVPSYFWPPWAVHYLSAGWRCGHTKPPTCLVLWWGRPHAASGRRRRRRRRSQVADFTHCNTCTGSACTHCNTLQHTATHCNTLQHIATHCNTLQRLRCFFVTARYLVTMARGSKGLYKNQKLLGENDTPKKDNHNLMLAQFFDV